MEQYRLIMPGHLNQFGYLFGGNLLQWVDEYAWIAASMEFPGRRFLTIGMDRVEFRRSIRQGAILRFSIRREGQGSTSVRYRVRVYDATMPAPSEPLFSTVVSFVRVDAEGRKKAIDLPGDDDAAAG